MRRLTAALVLLVLTLAVSGGLLGRYLIHS